MVELENKYEMAIWSAKMLFNKGLVSGSTGNLSFIHNGKMYVSQSGSCFGRIDKNSFAIVDMDGSVLEGKPSKEYPIHLAIYQNDTSIEAVIHTHSLNSTIFSCLKEVEKKTKDLFSLTPYLEMKTSGKIKCVDYARPGSKELFENFRNQVDKDVKAYILKNHGLVAAGKSMYEVFDLIEEFEMSAAIQIATKHYTNKEFNEIYE